LIFKFSQNFEFISFLWEPQAPNGLFSTTQYHKNLTWWGKSDCTS